MNKWPEGAILPGTRVRVVRDPNWDGPWEREFTGVLSPNVVPKHVKNPRAGEGELEYLVVFDEPQIDCDGCGPYVKAMIWSRYIRVDMRNRWVAPAVAPRPWSASMRVFELDAVARPDSLAVLEPEVLYQVSLPGGMEADLYTDAMGRAWYFETVPGIAMPDVAHVPNPVLAVVAAGATYVVHPAADGRFAVVLRFDEKTRLVEVVADPLPPVGSYGTGGHPLMSLLAGGPDRVSPYTLLQSLEASVGEGLGRLGAWLAEAVGRGQHVQVRLQVFYAGAGAVPTGVRADWSVDGQAATESFADA